MEGQEKTKEQLIGELEESRERLKELAQTGTERSRTEAAIESEKDYLSRIFSSIGEPV